MVIALYFIGALAYSHWLWVSFLLFQCEFVLLSWCGQESVFCLGRVESLLLLLCPQQKEASGPDVSCVLFFHLMARVYAVAGFRLFLSMMGLFEVCVDC